MINDNDLLKYICEDADMGRSSVNHVLKRTEDDQLCEVLKRQYSDYDKAYSNASERLENNRERAPHANPLTKLMAYVGTEMKTIKDYSSSKIAELVIQGSTMGVTSVTRQIHEYDGSNKDILDMAQNQVKMQESHIKSLKKFL